MLSNTKRKGNKKITRDSECCLNCWVLRRQGHACSPRWFQNLLNVKKNKSCSKEIKTVTTEREKQKTKNSNHTHTMKGRNNLIKGQDKSGPELNFYYKQKRYTEDRHCSPLFEIPVIKIKRRRSTIKQKTRVDFFFFLC